jgi:hypothetical protein
MAIISQWEIKKKLDETTPILVFVGCYLAIEEAMVEGNFEPLKDLASGVWDSIWD